MASGGWIYRNAYFMDFDGKYYKVTVSTAKGNGGIVIYNIGQMKEEALPKIKGSYAGNGNDPRGNASIDSIRSSGGNSQEESGESALYQRRDNTRTERDVLSYAADGDAANVRETVTGAGCSAIWTDRPTGEKTFLAETAKENAADHGGVQHSDCQSLGGLGRDFRERASVS